MVKIEVSSPWLRDEHLERPLKITKVNEVKGKYGSEIEIVALCAHEEVKFSCYGSNRNFMVYQFGSDTDNWIGNTVLISKESREWKGTIKEMRVFRVPK